MRFLILLLVFVYIEVSLAGLVVEHIGLLNTIGLMILSAFFGIFLIRRQGFLALENIRLSLEQGKTPTNDIVGGVLLVIAGFLFIFPGFFSDILGFLLLLPWLRKALTDFVKPRLGSSGAWFSRTVIYTNNGGWQSSETRSKTQTSRDSTLGTENGKTFTSSPSQVIIDCTPEAPRSSDADNENKHDGASSSADSSTGSADTYDVAAEDVTKSENGGDDAAEATDTSSRDHDRNR